MTKGKNGSILPPMTLKVKRTGQRVKGMGDQQLLRYRCGGTTIVVTSSGSTALSRWYIPGFKDPAAISESTGVSIADFYSTGVFKPGTTAHWVPSVGFTTSGRIFVGWCDNAEAIAFYDAASVINRGVFVRSLANCVSHPIYTEFTYNIPTKIRRKRFDVNNDVVTSDAPVEVIDRCVQGAFLIYIEGMTLLADTGVGQFLFNDVLDVEGIKPNYAT